jgi:guanine deaminase
MLPADLMRLAIDRCREGILAGQSPFGCAIARGDEILAVEHNTVWRTTDPTAHAEVNAIRSACRHAGSIDLSGAIVATTCEPCPMCMSALHWARVSEVHFGASVADAQQAGFNELEIAAEDVTRLGRSEVRTVPGLLRDECRGLFAEWLATQGHRAY